MAKRYWRRLALLAKTEVSYGTDPVPTGMANAIQAIDAVLTPLVAQQISRDLLRPYLGHPGVLLTGEHAMVEFSVELAGSGTAGTAPAFGPLLLACGMSETIVAATSVTYAPVSSLYNAVTIYFNRDGVRHVLLGARGSWTLDLTVGRVPRLRFRFLGLIGTISDTALPAVTLTAWKRPAKVNKANTTITLHGLALVTPGLTLDLGARVEPRMLVGEETIEIVDRQATGSVTPDAVLLATKNWMSIARGETTGALSAVHGTVAGNIATIAGPSVQIGPPTEQEAQGILTNTLPLILQPDAGNDELSIAFT